MSGKRTAAPAVEAASPVHHYDNDVLVRDTTRTPVAHAEDDQPDGGQRVLAGGQSATCADSATGPTPRHQRHPVTGATAG